MENEEDDEAMYCEGVNSIFKKLLEKKGHEAAMKFFAKTTHDWNKILENNKKISIESIALDDSDESDDTFISQRTSNASSINALLGGLENLFINTNAEKDGVDKNDEHDNSNDDDEEDEEDDDEEDDEEDDDEEDMNKKNDKDIDEDDENEEDAAVNQEEEHNEIVDGQSMDIDETFVMTRRGGSIHDDSFTMPINWPQKKVKFDKIVRVKTKSSSEQEDEEEEEDDEEITQQLQSKIKKKQEEEEEDDEEITQQLQSKIKKKQQEKEKSVRAPYFLRSMSTKAVNQQQHRRI